MSGRVCIMPDCGLPHLARGLCRSHYRMEKRRAPSQFRRSAPKVCTVDDCVRDATARGLCGSHYKRWRQGKPLDPPVRRYWDDLRCADVEWLLDSGEIPEAIAARMGCDEKSMRTGLRRAGRQDLLDRMRKEMAA